MTLAFADPRAQGAGAAGAMRLAFEAMAWGIDR